MSVELYVYMCEWDVSVELYVHMSVELYVHMHGLGVSVELDVHIHDSVLPRLLLQGAAPCPLFVTPCPFEKAEMTPCPFD